MTLKKFNSIKNNQSFIKINHFQDILKCKFLYKNNTYHKAFNKKTLFDIMDVLKL